MYRLVGLSTPSSFDPRQPNFLVSAVKLLIAQPLLTVLHIYVYMCVCVCVCVCLVTMVVWLFVTPMDYTYQSPLSMEFSKQEYWNGLTFPPPRDQIEPTFPASPVLQADSLPLNHQGIPIYIYVCRLKTIKLQTCIISCPGRGFARVSLLQSLL